VSLCIQIFILETRWSNSLSTSSSVCAIVAFPYTTTASGKVSSLIEYFIEWRFFSVYFEFFGVSFYLHILYFVWRSLSVLLSLLICYLYFLIFLSLSFFFFLSALLYFYCSSSMCHVINRTYSYSVTCGHLYIITSLLLFSFSLLFFSIAFLYFTIIFFSKYSPPITCYYLFFVASIDDTSLFDASCPN